MLASVTRGRGRRYGPADHVGDPEPECRLGAVGEVTAGASAWIIAGEARITATVEDAAWRAPLNLPALSGMFLQAEKNGKVVRIPLAAGTYSTGP